MNEVLKTAVLYHGGCYDGFGAAWVAWNKFKDQADYFPVYHGSPPPNLDLHGHVYLLDFSYPRDVMRKLSVTRPFGYHVTVLDHHKTAQEELAWFDAVDDYKNLRIVFDMKRSGAMLALNHFYPGEEDQMIAYIQDRDLWKFELPYSKEFTMYLRTIPFEFERWNIVSRTMNSPAQDAIFASGSAMLRYVDAEVEKAVAPRNRLRVRLGHHTVHAVNAHMLFSEIADALCKDNPFGVAFRIATDGVTVSLRSRTKFDVAELAKSYGGGGHQAAAGFVIPLDQWAMMLEGEGD